MVDCIEENYEYYLPQSIMSELNTSFEVKTKLSSETVSSSSPATEPSDTEDESLSHFWSKEYLLNALSLNRKTLLLQKKLMNDLTAKTSIWFSPTSKDTMRVLSVESTATTS